MAEDQTDRESAAEARQRLESERQAFADSVYRAMYRYEARKAVAALFAREGWTVREGDRR